jgi:hypothetical protein
MRASRSPALLVLVLMLATGCGGSRAATPPAAPSATDSATTSSDTGSGADSAGAQCPATSVILETLGITAPDDSDPIGTGTETVICKFEGTRAGEPAGVVLRLSLDATPDDFVQFRKDYTSRGYTTTNRSGLGDEAFSFALTTGANPVNGMAARKGKVFVYVEGQVPFDQEAALASRLLAS